MNKQKIYEMISSDIPVIDRQLEKREGSQRLWDQLKTRYDLVLPDIIKVIKVGGKIGTIGLEYDFRPELRKLKEALATWIWMNEDDIKFDSSEVFNHAKALIESGIVKSDEHELNNLLNESLIYILKSEYREKRIGLEKVYDTFERMKTLYDDDKKKSIEQILGQMVSNDTKIKDVLNKEMK